jgi:hypothetical protein
MKFYLFDGSENEYTIPLANHEVSSHELLTYLLVPSAACDITIAYLPAGGSQNETIIKFTAVPAGTQLGGFDPVMTAAGTPIPVFATPKGGVFRFSASAGTMSGHAVYRYKLT